MKAMARSVILRVRSKVAPSGITRSTVKNPWSSSGIKLVGITRFNTKMNTITIPKPARMRLGFRIAFSSKWPYLLFPLANQILILRKTIFFFFLFGRRIIAHMAGLNVNATTVDNSTETTIVMENWRYKAPVIPLKKLTGTNTAANTIEVAIKAPDNSCMALWVASRAVRCSSCIKRSTFSTTTIASSTTIPIARIKPNKVNILSENPMISIKPNVPIKEIGTAIVGIKAARQFCKDRNTTNTTKNRASNKVLYTSWIDCDIYSVASKGNLYSNPSGKFWLISFIASFTFVATSSALAPGNI